MLNSVTINFMLEAIINPQIQYLLLLQEFRDFSNGLLDNFFLLTTMLGENFILLTLITVIYWVINKNAGIFIFLNLAMSVVLNLFIKLTACINRPWVLDSRIYPIEEAIPQAGGYSFPSGHTARAVGVWGAIAYLWWKNKFIRFISITLVLLIGFSRNYIGVHTPQDVIVSLFLGIFTIWAISKILKLVDKKPNIDFIVFTIALLLGFFIYGIIYIKCFNQMLTYNEALDAVHPLIMKHSEYGKLGFFFGVFCGWILERRFVNFSIENLSIQKKIIIAIFGISLLHIIPNFISFVFGNIIPNHILSALIKFFTAIFVLAIYPIFIKFIASR